MKKAPEIILILLNIILFAVCTFFYLSMDKSEPLISFQETETIYREDIDKTALLEGVQAIDRKDGDVSDRIVIEKITENREEGTCAVYYAVSDKAGNVAKASRVFRAVYPEAETVDVHFKEAGIDAELAGNAVETGWLLEKEMTLEKAESEPSASPTPEPTPTMTPEVTAEPTETPEPEATPEPTPKPKPTVNPAVPILTLKMSQVKTAAGVHPAWVNVIGTLKDDKDNYETLFANLKVSKYDIHKKGTYQVSVSTEDSDGNSSAAVPLTLIVQ